MVRYRVLLSLDRETWINFQKQCKEKYLIPSYEIEKFIKEKLKHGKNK